jgi:predicted MPP superfamily phosphohydrolase
MTCSRRDFLRAAAVGVSAAASLGAYTWRVEPHWVETVRRPLPLRGLPTGLRGATLMHLSDLHVGHRVDERYLIRALDHAAVLRPDIVALTGDFIEYRRGYDWAALERVVARVPRGRLATLAIFGNHDYGWRWAEAAVAERVGTVLNRHGMQVLRNERAEVGGLRVAGVDDFWSPRFAPAPALAELAGGPDALVLCHNPDAVDLRAFEHVHGWVLAGHTHGGQCRPPFLPPPILPVRNRRYTAGAFSVGPDRMLYINRALGHLFQVRFNVRPEVTLFTLVERTDSPAGAEV